MTNPLPCYTSVEPYGAHRVMQIHGMHIQINGHICSKSQYLKPHVANSGSLSALMDTIKVHVHSLGLITNRCGRCQRTIHLTQQWHCLLMVEILFHLANQSFFRAWNVESENTFLIPNSVLCMQACIHSLFHDDVRCVSYSKT